MSAILYSDSDCHLMSYVTFRVFKRHGGSRTKCHKNVKKFCLFFFFGGGGGGWGAFKRYVLELCMLEVCSNFHLQELRIKYGLNQLQRCTDTSNIQ